MLGFGEVRSRQFLRNVRFVQDNGEAKVVSRTKCHNRTIIQENLPWTSELSIGCNFQVKSSDPEGRNDKA